MNVDNTLCSHTDFKGKVHYQLMVNLLRDDGHIQGGTNYRIVRITKVAFDKLKALGIPLLDDEVRAIIGKQKSDSNG